MAISLQKGGNVSLSKQAPGLKRIRFGLGWDLRKTDGSAFDLDASAFVLDSAGKVLSDQHFVFYNNTQDPSGAVVHKGDNHGGEGEGDDEALEIELGRVPADVQKIAFTVTIHEAEQRRQNFGQVGNAYIRLVNADTNSEVTRYDLAEDASTETAMIFGELYRHGSDWKFRAVGQGFAGGLGPLAKNYGVNV